MSRELRHGLAQANGEPTDPRAEPLERFLALGADELSEKGVKIVKRGRRVKHRNPVSTQDSYTRLVEISRSLGASAKTRELGALAGIKGTDKGLMGALAMLEVRGVIHAVVEQISGVGNRAPRARLVRRRGSRSYGLTGRCPSFCGSSRLRHLTRR